MKKTKKNKKIMITDIDALMEEFGEGHFDPYGKKGYGFMLAGMRIMRGGFGR